MSILPIGNTPPPRWQDNSPENTYQQTLDQIYNDCLNYNNQAGLSLLSSLIHQVKNSGGDPGQVSKALAQLNQLQSMLQATNPITPLAFIGLTVNTCKTLVANL